MPEERTHEESSVEFHTRVQKQMDRESFEGRDDCGDKFPKRGIVHEFGPKSDEPPHIYKWDGK